MAGCISSDFLSLKVALGLKADVEELLPQVKIWGGSYDTSTFTSLHIIIKNLGSCVDVLQMLTCNSSSRMRVLDAS